MASTQREREEAKRAAKLADVEKQVEAGSLSIRQMTDEERERYRLRPENRPPSRSRRTYER
jgi:hypothetical protein